MANHSEKEWEWKGQKFKVLPGQFITSLGSIMKQCGKGITEQNVRTALKRFEKLDFLTDESTKQGRLITIIKWGIFQGDKEKPNNKPNRQLTDTSQRPNRQLTPNKNDKECKNDKKENKPCASAHTPSRKKIPPTLEDVQAYCVERSNGVDAQRFIDFYESKGWLVGKAKMKDWRASVRTWESKNGGGHNKNPVKIDGGFEI